MAAENLYTKENENSWKERDSEGLAQFLAEEFVWHGKDMQSKMQETEPWIVTIMQSAENARKKHQFSFKIRDSRQLSTSEKGVES